MNCEICGADSSLVILPIHKPGGSLITLACIDCARVSGHYCMTHDTAHTDYTDGGSACAECLRERMAVEESTVGNKLSTIRESLEGEALYLFDNVITMMAGRFGSESRALSYLLSLRSLQQKTDTESVFRKMISERTAASLLPQLFR